jgi:hypothetical protein
MVLPVEICPHHTAFSGYMYRFEQYCLERPPCVAWTHTAAARKDSVTPCS